VRALPARVGHALSFGAYLKQSRVLRELTLDEVVAQTKLPQRIVEALEADDLQTLHDRAFALLAVRSCAAAIGLDPEETALRLEEQWSQSVPPGPAEPLWRRVWQVRPREPAVWIVIGATLVVCIALLLRR
jgi:cytoskeletal protein RodZ